MSIIATFMWWVNFLNVISAFGLPYDIDNCIFLNDEIQPEDYMICEVKVTDFCWNDVYRGIYCIEMFATDSHTGGYLDEMYIWERTLNETEWKLGLPTKPNPDDRRWLGKVT